MKSSMFLISQTLMINSLIALKNLMKVFPEIAEKYIKAFYEDVGALNVKKATSNPRVMHHMGEIIDFIKELEMNMHMKVTVMSILEHVNLMDMVN